jgi:hypothetical protein
MTYKSMLILQSCRDLEKCVPVPCSETYATPSHNANQAVNIKVEEDSDIEVEEHPVPMTFVGIKSEHEVSCMSVCPHFTHNQNGLLSLLSPSVH